MVEQEENSLGEGFSPEWLTLREPADHAARSLPLTHQLAAWARQHSPLKVLELGCGTGSNLRYLCPHLGHEQHWTLLDYDDVLLETLPATLQEWSNNNNIDMSRSNGVIRLSNHGFSATVRWDQVDLANELQKLPFEETQLVTASALLDLTSETWLQQLAKQCIDMQCASLFVLNYDGRIQWQPSTEADERVSALLNEHQLSDKGFGYAMGPRAGHCLARLLGRHQQVIVTDSDWRISPQQAMLQTALIDGWLEAAKELAAAEFEKLDQWHYEHVQHIASMNSSLTVGHTDILSFPSEPGPE